MLFFGLLVGVPRYRRSERYIRSSKMARREADGRMSYFGWYIPEWRNRWTGV